MIRNLLLLFTCLLTIRATIVITSPLQTPFTNNQIDYLYFNFGQIPYGKTLAFDIFITNSSLCSTDDLQHFTKPTYVVARISTVSACSFTKRALNAQANGAKGLIMASPSYDYVEGKVFQGDDGNGKRVHITTLMISNSDFQKLKTLKAVEIIANYPIPKETQTILSVFLSSSKRSSYVFLREFSEHYKYLKNYTIIEPVFHTVTCKGCSSVNCLFDYCCYDYENSKYDVGSKIILQQLHQYQIFRQKGVQKWFEYMNLFDEYCISNWYMVDQCVKKILKQMNMSDASTRQNPSEMLNQWKSKEFKLGFDSFPEVAINGMIYRGNFDTDQILQALCESLNNPPQYCIDGSTPAENTEKTNSHLAIILVVACFTIVFVSLIGVVLYRKFIKRELTNDMVSRVGELVANYANKVSKQKIRQKQKFIEANGQEL